MRLITLEWGLTVIDGGPPNPENVTARHEMTPSVFPPWLGAYYSSTLARTRSIVMSGSQISCSQIPHLLSQRLHSSGNDAAHRSRLGGGSKDIDGLPQNTGNVTA
ncbi:hypothetical protein CDAR_301921 [Caerostris darwini]|uniref:Uncharacterized protein n=1 Tax=Caerostris darwini TaxID=1538125 RepID=A0AAV4UGP7_9ARAC|nr:hypothetical protein CDAR_301921 [Caerostris darwini]